MRMTGVRPGRRTTSIANPSILRARAQSVMSVTARSRWPCSAHWASYIGDLAGMRMYSVRAGTMSPSQVRWTWSSVRSLFRLMGPTILPGTTTLVSYLPTLREWEAKPPAKLGLRQDGLAAAIAYHRAHESSWPRDSITESGRFIGVADEPADSQVLGPVRPRKDPNGLIVRRGYIVAEWGDTRRVDMSFSIAKSY